MTHHRSNDSPVAAAIQPNHVWSAYFASACLAAIVVATCIAYSPAMTGGALWDDDAHLTKPSIRLLPSFPQPYLNLARSFAVLGRSQEAVATAEKGLEVARSANQESVATAIETWLTHYRIELEREIESQNNAGSK